MSIQATFGLKQLIFLIVLAVLLIAGLGLGAFLLGQQNALRLANQPTLLPETLQAATQVAIEVTTLADAPQATLPRAMTATPKPATGEEIVFTDAQATQLAQEEAARLDTEIPFEIKALSFSAGRATLTGAVSYLGYSGQFNITGTPYVESQRLRIRLNSVTIAGQGLPGDLYAELETQLNTLFGRVFTGYDVQAVAVEEGQMRLTVIPW